MRDVEKAAGFLNLFADNVSAGMDVEPIEWIQIGRASCRERV